LPVFSGNQDRFKAGYSDLAWSGKATGVGKMNISFERACICNPPARLENFNVLPNADGEGKVKISWVRGVLLQADWLGNCTWGSSLENNKDKTDLHTLSSKPESVEYPATCDSSSHVQALL
jgi:hypothetical protein